MSPSTLSRSAHQRVLGQALRLIRQARRLRTRDAAEAIGVSQRTYEYLEAGKGSLDFERIQLFAAATQSDAFAILAATFIGSPAFALRSADNKLATALLIAMQEFDQDLLEDIALLDARTCISTFTGAFGHLTAEARRRAAARDGLVSVAQRPADEDEADLKKG